MPTILERMDEQVAEFPLEGEHLSVPPSDYFRRQCYASFAAGEWNLAASAKWLGADRVLWASHYPHPRYSEHVLDTLVTALAPLEESERAQILCTSEVEAYGLPIPATV